MNPRAIHTKFSGLRLLAILLALTPAFCPPAAAQREPERFWVAGRYDGNRVIIYFNAVKFEGTLQANSQNIPEPVANGFFEPVRIPSTFLARFQNAPDAEHFAIGDLYDVMLGNGVLATVRLTTLLGCETDEEVGNDSYAGALGTVLGKNDLASTKGYYAVRKHVPVGAGTTSKPKTAADYMRTARLGDEPIRFDTESQIAQLLHDRMKLEATDAERRVAENVAPALTVQTFHLADGSARLYARAQWSPEVDPAHSKTYALGAWMVPAPTLHILSVEKQRSFSEGVDSYLPELLNVVDLGDGRTGIVVELQGEDNTALDLAEYRDGQNILTMRLLQSISSGE